MVKDTKELAAIDGWCRVRDIVKLLYLKHHAEAAKTFANRQTDPRNLKADKPVEPKVGGPAVPTANKSQRDRKREREQRENEVRKQAGGGGGGGGDWNAPSEPFPEREPGEIVTRDRDREPEQRTRERVAKPTCSTCGRDDCGLRADRAKQRHRGNLPVERRFWSSRGPSQSWAVRGL